jgi:hypothetical protein
MFQLLSKAFHIIGAERNDDIKHCMKYRVYKIEALLYFIFAPK